MNYLLRFKNDFLGFLRFLKKPNDMQLVLSTQKKFILIFNLLIIEILFYLILIAPLDELTENFLTLKEEQPTESMTLFTVFFFAVILAPLIEELIFRYWMKYNKLFSTFISRDKWNKIFPFAVYISSLIFGFIHLSNYVVDSWKFYALSPLIIISQLSGGFILSYIRVRVGILYSIIYHAIWNLLFAIIVPLVYGIFTPPLSEHTLNYDLKIEQKAFADINSDSAMFDIKATQDTIYSIDAKQYDFQELLNHLYGKKKLTSDEGLIDIRFKSRKGVSKKEFLDILKKNYEIK